MQVETYEVTETTSAGPECDAEALLLIEKLGLTAQMDRVTAPVDTGVRNPYRLMTREEEQVYRILMPKKSDLKEYGDGPIPLRVLQVAAHAESMFDRLMVWCPETGPKDDPILVGVNTDRQHRFMERERFLLARWGDCLLPFETMADKAKAIAKDRVRDLLSKMTNEVKVALDSLDTMSAERLLKLAIEQPHVYIP